jgi:hypothetical protein
LSWKQSGSKKFISQNIALHDLIRRLLSILPISIFLPTGINVILPTVLVRGKIFFKSSDATTNSAP